MSGDIHQDLAEKTAQIADLYEAAAREAKLLTGEAAVRIVGPSRCGGCGVFTNAVFFRSRGWVCAWCENERDG